MNVCERHTVTAVRTSAGVGGKRYRSLFLRFHHGWRARSLRACFPGTRRMPMFCRIAEDQFQMAVIVGVVDVNGKGVRCSEVRTFVERIHSRNSTQVSPGDPSRVRPHIDQAN